MPAAPRPDKKVTKIAYKIMGIPANQNDYKTEEQKRINRRLLWELTSKVR